MKNKKILLGVGALALLGVAYYMMKKKKGTVENVIGGVAPITSVSPTALTRAQMQDEIYQANLWRTGGTDKNFSRASYDRISDADLAMIYDVDVKKIPVTPEYVTMLKLYGWA